MSVVSHEKYTCDHCRELRLDQFYIIYFVLRRRHLGSFGGVLVRI
jgi:hypothetical protein